MKNKSGRRYWWPSRTRCTTEDEIPAASLRFAQIIESNYLFACRFLGFGPSQWVQGKLEPVSWLRLSVNVCFDAPLPVPGPNNVPTSIFLDCRRAKRSQPSDQTTSPSPDGDNEAVITLPSRPFFCGSARPTIVPSNIGAQTLVAI
jgi:hypothetical protein